MAAGPAVEGDVEAKLEGLAVLEGVGMGAARARSKDAHATRCLSRNKTQLGRAPPASSGASGMTDHRPVYYSSGFNSLKFRLSDRTTLVNVVLLVVWYDRNY